MTAGLQELSAQYAACFQNFLSGKGEASLRQAYDLGRQALIDGLGVLEITVLYHQALSEALQRTTKSPEAIRTILSGESFFLESLAAFEMTHRGIRETNVLLHDSDERYRELFENASDIVFITDFEGNIVSINPAGEQIMGYRSGEVPLVKLSGFVAPEYRKAARDLLQNGRTGAPACFYEMELISKDGRRIPVEINSRAILRDGAPVGVQGIARDITDRRWARQALQRLNEALEEEAKRIAHAIHDEAGQLLASVHIALEEVAADDPKKMGAGIAKVKDLLFKIEEQLRQMSHELRPTILDDFGIRPAIEFLADNVSRRTGVDIQLSFSLEDRLGTAVETTLYRITQEALNNISKHAQAKHVWIELRANGDIHCQIRDDGVGFDVNAIFGQKGRAGLGLRGAQERLAAVGGTLAISSTPGSGTSLLVSIPKSTRR